MRAGGEVVTEVAQGVFEMAEHLVVGKIDEFVSQALEENVGLAMESGEELLTPHFATLRGLFNVRRGFVQHGNHPGVRANAATGGGSIFPQPSHSSRTTRISHLLFQGTPAKGLGRGKCLTEEIRLGVICRWWIENQ
jgi:hypothetical protein